VEAIAGALQEGGAAADPKMAVAALEQGLAVPV
jgi:hypothetical protein